MKVRILSWNINSVRLRIKSLVSIIEEYQPNVVCLQETKCPNDLFPYQDFYNLGLKNVFEQSYEFTYLVFLSILFSFIFSYFTIKFFLHYINKFSLTIFVIYRIVVAIILFLIIYT